MEHGRDRVTVGDLIAVLRRFPADAELFVYEGSGGYGTIEVLKEDGQTVEVYDGWNMPMIRVADGYTGPEPTVSRREDGR